MSLTSRRRGGAAKKSVSTLVRELRQGFGLTQEQFAQKAGVTYSTVNHWENGKRAPQPFLLRRLLEMKEEARTTAPDAALVSSAAGRWSGGHARSMVDEIVRRIVARFNPEAVILFGSRARGTGGADSDVDLLVVMAVTGSKRAQRLALRLAVRDVPVSKDILLTTPEEFAWRKETPGTIERSAVRDGTVLYARA